MEPKKTQRKYHLACYFALAGTAGMFIYPYPIKGDDFIWLAAFIIGLYGGFNVIQAIGWPSGKKPETK